MAYERPPGKPGANRIYDREVLLVALEKYIEDTRLPIIAEFCYLNKVHRKVMYAWPEFEDMLDLCMAKKETTLERMCLEGMTPPAMAIFSLKQMGWTDRGEMTHKGDKAAPLELILNGSDVQG